ncbi:MAG: ATP-binding protein, partial [Flavobacteriaceae bacterium]|nr:ATP-binding protein [Flavobacteriaceae bacterium]
VTKIAKTLQDEVAWFEAIVNTALSLYFKNKSAFDAVKEHAPPSLDNDNSKYAILIKENELGFEERLVLILALLPFIKPQSLDVFLIKNQNLNSEFSEFGGIKDSSKLGFIPTLETASFILTAQKLEERLAFIRFFNKNNVLFTKGILSYDSDQDFDLHQKLIITNEYLGLFTIGEMKLPQYSARFPAKEITTELEWEDLIVDPHVNDDLLEVKDWLIHSELILKEWKLEKNLKSGYRVLFYGPPGTGKTLSATLLGKETKQPVFRVDLSLVVSKYIGETEKNLGKLFDEAENKKWILFFDEADALFGKRTQTKSSNDRYANQEVAYLLQRIEDFAGLVILATNIQTNIDEAFSRRFQSMVHFPKPGKKQRRLLWKRLFKDSFDLENDINLDELADKYELTGGEMINILRYCALGAARRNKKSIELKDILKGIRREYGKSNKTI